MTVLSNSLVFIKNSPNRLLSVDQCIGSGGLTKLSFKTNKCTSKRELTVQASYSDGGRPSSGSIFISGFVWGGLVVGTPGAVYTPQISKALAGAEKNDLMRKPPKFIYDGEKALERTHKILSEKIEQLNSAIDDVSAQLHSEDCPNGVAVDADEIKAAICTFWCHWPSRLVYTGFRNNS